MKMDLVRGLALSIVVVCSVTACKRGVPVRANGGKQMRLRRDAATMMMRYDGIFISKLISTC